MIAHEFEYSAPASLDEALAKLADDGTKPLAGGMTLVPLMKLRFAAPAQLVDLARIPGLNEIREESGAIRIGALTTHYQVETSPLLHARCPLLPETASCIGDVQIRNSGTIGGSAAHADPAADYPAALLALDARFQLASKGGSRTVAASEFFVDTFTTALEPGEIITEIVVPMEEAGTGVAYLKHSHPASGFAVVGAAVRIRVEGGRITMARIALTGIANKAYRAPAAERVLEGAEPGTAAIDQAASAVTAGIEANSDLYASAEFRAHLARVYAARAIRRALSALR